MKNVYLNHTLKEYNAKYSNRKYRLLKFTKKEVEENDKKCPYNTKGYILKGRKWWLIKDTYYEIPKPIRLTWFRNLNAGVQTAVCLLGIGAVTAAIVTPAVLLSSNAKGIISEIDGTGKDLIKSVTFKKQSDGSYTGKIELKESAKVEEIESVSILVTENDETTELKRDKDYTLDVYNGDIKINAGVIKTNNPKITVEVKRAEKTKKYIITATVEGEGGTVSPEEQEYEKGETAEVIAKPESGYKFAGWFEDGVKIEDAEATYSFVVTCKRTLTAKFEEDVPGEKLAFTPISGTNNCSVKAASGASISGKLEIPSTAIIEGNEYNVTKIEERGFADYTDITEVVLPNTLESIGSEAFDYCLNLEKINIPISLTEFAYDSFESTSLKSIIVDSGNTKYDSRNNCNAIIETSSDKMVLGCGASTFPSDVTSIGDHAFYDCLSLTSINISSSIKSIGEAAFEGCYYLESLTLNEGLENIDDYAFSDCANLKSLHIPASVNKIGYSIVSWSSQIDTITVDINNKIFDSRNNCNAIINTRYNKLICGCVGTKIPNTIKTIGEYAFYGCDGLKNVDIPDGVTEIGYSAFQLCTNLGIDGSKLIMPSTLIRILPSAFSNCEALKEVVLNNGLLEIWDDVFLHCSKLNTINIPNTVTQINNWAFYECESLEEIAIPSSVTYIGYEAFTNSGLKRCYFKDTTNSWLFGDDQEPEIPFKPCGDDEETSTGTNASTLVGDSYDYAKNIPVEADYYFFGFDSEGEQAPDWEAAYFEIYCTNRRACTKATIPANHPLYNTTPITGFYYDNENSDGAFSKSSRLETVSYEESDNITSIGKFCFANCRLLKSVLIPKNVKKIGSGSFINTYTYTDDLEIKFEDANSVWDIDDEDNPIFIPYTKDEYDIYGDSGLNVNAYYLEYYYWFDWVRSEDEVLADFRCIGFDANDEEIPDESKYSEADHFKIYCSNKTKNPTKAIIPAVDPEYGIKVTGFYIDESGEEPEGAFEDCDSLLFVEFEEPDNIVGIDEYAFEDCDSLVRFEMPENIKYIKLRAFCDCVNLRDITIPSGVEIIDSYAFADCDSLKTINFEDTTSKWNEYDYDGELIDVYEPGDPKDNAEHFTDEDIYDHYYVKLGGTQLSPNISSKRYESETISKDELPAGTYTFIFKVTPEDPEEERINVSTFCIKAADDSETYLTFDPDNFVVYVDGCRDVYASISEDKTHINFNCGYDSIVKITITTTTDAMVDMKAIAYSDA